MPLSRPNNDDEGPIIRVRRIPIDNNLDMTPMIDVTFLLLIFFLVSSIPDAKSAPQLPAAESGIGVGSKTALILCVAEGAQRGVDVYLADGKLGEPLPAAPSVQEARIREAAEAARRGGIGEVLIKAERRVHYRHVERIVRAAAVPGIRVNLAVMELR